MRVARQLDQPSFGRGAINEGAYQETITVVILAPELEFKRHFVKNLSALLTISKRSESAFLKVPPYRSKPESSA